MEIQDREIKLSNGYWFIEPLKIYKGDHRVKLNGATPKVDCRVIAEEGYQELINEIKRLEQQNEKSSQNK